MKKLGLLFAFAMLLFACKKEEFPENQVVSTAFEAKGNIDGEDFDLTPGTNGLYLYTDVITVSEDQYLFSAHIASEDGSNDHGEMRFEWITPSGTLNSQSEMLNSLAPQTAFSLDAEYADEATLSWQGDLEDVESFMLNGMPIMEDVGSLQYFADEGINLSITQFDNPSTYIRQSEYNVFPMDACSPFHEFATMEIMVSSEGVVFHPVLEEEEVAIEWQVGGEFVTTLGDEPLVLDDLPPFSPVEVTFTIIDPLQGAFVTGFENIINLGAAERTFDAIEFVSFRETGSHMAVYYYPPNSDLEFESHNGCLGILEQPEWAFFEVIEVEDFESNEDGLATKRLTLDGAVQLSAFDAEGNLEIMDLEFESLSIAFPYEE